MYVSDINLIALLITHHVSCTVNDLNSIHTSLIYDDELDYEVR